MAVERFLETHNVKDNEKVIWDFAKPWLPQVHDQLVEYIKRDRRKSTAHQRFATELLGLLTEALADHNQFNETLAQVQDRERKGVITPEQAKHQMQDALRRKDHITPILHKLQLKTGLSQKGYNRKISWLYFFCKSAHIQYTHFKRIERMHDNFVKQNQHALQTLHGKLKQLEGELGAAQTNNLSLQREQRKIVDEKSEVISDRERIRREKEDTKKTLEETNSRNQNITSALQKSEAEIASKRAEIATITRTLEEVKINLTGTTNTSLDLKRKNEELEKYKHMHAQEVELRAVEAKANAQLRIELEEAHNKLSLVQQCYDNLKNWVDGIFGNVFGNLVSSFFDKKLAAPFFNEGSIKLFQKVAIAAKPADVEYEVEAKLKDLESANSFERRADAALSHTGALLGQSLTAGIAAVSKMQLPDPTAVKEKLSAALSPFKKQPS